jgi:hypothetical protein
MKKYQMHGGGIVEGSSPKEIIEKLRARSFNPGGCLQEFMDLTAQACRQYNGAEVRSDTIEHLFDDLITTGYLKEI